MNSILTKLTGSVKQVAWAASIRHKTIEALEKDIPALLVPYLVRWYDEAKWWIDCRYIVVDKFNQIGKSKIITYPQKFWEEYEQEYAHEGYGGHWVHRSLELLNINLIEGAGDELDEQVICQNPTTKEWELWHYTPCLF